MGIAARVAAWEKRYGGWLGFTPARGPSAVRHPIVEMYIDEMWVDITSYVLYQEGVEITRGRSGESDRADPSSCAFVLKNHDGRWSPRNPTGVYYGKIGRNTPVRVSVVRNGVRRYRFYGEVSEWNTEWEISGNHIWTRVVAAGITRRLDQGAAALRSALFRELTHPRRTGIVAYWPCEDLDGSDSVAPGLSHGPMTYIGKPTFEEYTDWPGSAPLLTVGSATFTGRVPAYTATGEASIRLYIHVPADGVSMDTTLADIYCSGTAKRWQISLSTSGGLSITVYDRDGAVLSNPGFVAFDVNDERSSIILELTQDGADIDWALLEEEFSSSGQLITDTVTRVGTSGTVSGETFGRVTKVVIGALSPLGDTSVGHIAVADDLSAFTNAVDAGQGWRGENPNSRITRLCKEEGISFQSISKGQSGNTILMGAQGQKDLMSLLRECGDTDLGILHEPRDEIGIAYRSRLSLYNQDAAFDFDYAQHQLSGPPIPVDDDRLTRNDVTVQRDGGSFARETLEEGALSIQDAPDGVGRYETQTTISLAEDSALGDQAGWRLHLGTVDESRFPQISVNLRHSTFTDDAAKMSKMLTLDVGDRITVSNPPSWLPPDQITQIVTGYTEKLGAFEHDMVLHCTPETPYHISEVEGDFGRVDTDGSSLVSAVSSSATSLSVATQDGSAVWADTATFASDFPFDIRVGGEVMTVTEITGTTSPQTFTVTRSVNGVTKSHSAGSDVRLAYPAIVPL